MNNTASNVTPMNAMLEAYIRAGFAHGFGLHRLDCCGRSHRHERRRADFPAHHLDGAGTGFATCGMDRE